jgi:hypothetical protein
VSARRTKTRRRAFDLDDATLVNLRIKAKAHGVSQVEFIRAAINGTRPGAKPGSLVAKADHWWDTRKPSRRVSVYENHSSDKDADTVDDAQLTFEVPDE